MINFYDVNDPSRKLHPDSWLGKLLRLPLRVIPKNAVLPILQGPGKGLKWIVGSYNHGCWLGSYEFEKQTVLHEILRPGDVIYDIGAHVGYFAIIFGKLVGAAGAVYAFEPMRENYEFLLQHIAINHLSNVTAVCAGIAASSGTACFMAPHHHAMSHRTDSGPVRVPVYNLEEYVRENHLPAPNLIKMDIEGEELFVLPSILEFVVRHRTKLLLSTHDNGSSGILGKLLSSRGYSVRPLQWASHPANETLPAPLCCSRVWESGAEMSLFRQTVYPESRFGGFGDINSTVISYNRVRSLLQESSVVLDVHSRLGTSCSEFRNFEGVVTPDDEHRRLFLG